MSQSYDPPPPPKSDLGNLAHPELGSLTQSVRKKGLGAARGWLIFVGIVTILWNVVQMATFDSMFDNLVKQEQEKAQRQGMMLELKPDAKEQARRIVFLICGGTIVLGVVFIGLGAMVYRYPVVCTVTGLVLYLGAQALFGYLDPESLAKGFIIKLIIIVALAKAIQAALAYEKEERAQRELGTGYSA